MSATDHARERLHGAFLTFVSDKSAAHSRQIDFAFTLGCASRSTSLSPGFVALDPPPQLGFALTPASRAIRATDTLGSRQASISRNRSCWSKRRLPSTPTLTIFRGRKSRLLSLIGVCPLKKQWAHPAPIQDRIPRAGNLADTLMLIGSIDASSVLRNEPVSAGTDAAARACASRYRRRHLNNMSSFSLCCRAICATHAPGFSIISMIDCQNSDVKLGRFGAAVTTSPSSSTLDSSNYSGGLYAGQCLSHLQDSTH